MGSLNRQKKVKQYIDVSEDVASALNSNDSNWVEVKSVESLGGLLIEYIRCYIYHTSTGTSRIKGIRVLIDGQQYYNEDIDQTTPSINRQVVTLGSVLIPCHKVQIFMKAEALSLVNATCSLKAIAY